MWRIATVLLLTVLWRPSLCQQRLQSQGDGCSLNENELDAIFEAETATWSVTDHVLERHDIQEIVNCTTERDIISLRTGKRIQPRGRIVIPWELTIRGSVDGVAEEKASMTCPEGEGLFLLKSGLELRNVKIDGCDLDNAADVTGIIETDACSSRSNGRSDRMQLLLNQVNFTSNRNAGGALLSVTEPDCYKIGMSNVVFRSNRYNRQSNLSNSNELKEVSLVSNLNIERSRHTPLFYLPPESDSSVDLLFARENNDTLFYVDRALFDLRNSTFLRNTAGNRGLIFANASDVSMSSSLFDTNNNTVVQGCLVGSGHRFECGHGQNVFEKTNAEIRNVHFVKNSAPFGGAFHLIRPGNTVFELCSFKSNTAFDSYYGGGAVSITGSINRSPDGNSVRFFNCDFQENLGCTGGAIYAYAFHKGKIVIEDSTFSSNVAGSGGSASSGGAVSVKFANNVIMRVDGSVFESNAAHDEGGAIEIRGSSGELSIVGSNFSKCLSGRGGAVYIGEAFRKKLAVRFDDSEFIKNSADDFNGYGRGGAVYAHDVSGDIKMDNCTFLRNEAVEVGGAFYATHSSQAFYPKRTSGDIKLNSCTFLRNEAREGGAVSATVISGDIKLDNCTFLRNEATEVGGAVFATHTSGDVKLDNCTFLKNNARDGGGVYAHDTSGDIKVDNCTFLRNEATQVGGAVSAKSTSSRIKLDNCSFLENEALLDGGALFVHEWSGSFRLLNSTFQSNAAHQDGGAVVISHLSGSFRLVNSAFQSNTAHQTGGAVKISHLSGSFRLVNSDFQSNNASNIGGALSIDSSSGPLKIRNSNFSKNEAEDGGAIYIRVQSGAVELIETTFEANLVKGTGRGGAMYLAGTHGEIKMTENKFSKNSGQYGGAIFGQVRGTMNVVRCVFDENQSERDGGALCMRNGDAMDIENSTFVRNKARSGGGIACRSTENASVTHSSFKRNEASVGGGIYASETALDVTDCNIAHNKAKLRGGGLCFVAASRIDRLQLIDSKIVKNKADLGGALHCCVRFGCFLSGGAFFQIDPRAWVYETVKIVRTIFKRNHAKHAGGGFFIDTVHIFFFDSLRRFDPDASDPRRCSNRDCPGIVGNSVGQDGYGRNIASAAVSHSLTVVYEKLSEVYIISSKRSISISKTRAGSPLSGLRVTVSDWFNHGPSVAKTQSLLYPDEPNDQSVRFSAGMKAVIPGLDSQFSIGLIKDPLSYSLIRNRNDDLESGSLLQTSRTYSLSLPIVHDQSSHVTAEVTLFACLVNEKLNRKDMQCVECDLNQYNFDLDDDTCKRCPDHCNCTEWGIAPVKKHWVPSPCYAEATECLSGSACDYKGREDKLVSFYRKIPPDCSIHWLHNTKFNEIQCNDVRKSRRICQTCMFQGYEGRLCGSCSEDFGSFGLDCYECVDVVLVALSLIAVTIWLLVATGIVVEGNLTDAAAGQAASLPLSGSGNHKEAQDIAKRRVTELIKLFINFSQVSSLAMAINTRWTELMKYILQIQDIVGAVSAETFSLDCLLPTSLPVPRSIIRESVSILRPFLVLSIGYIFWRNAIRNDASMLKNRLILTTVALFYISFIGWVKHLSSVLNCVPIPNDVYVSDSTSNVYWTVDTSVECWKGSHFALVGFLAVPMIVYILLAFPIGSAVYLIEKRRSDELELPKVQERFGFMYGAYTEQCVYWDSVIMLRKAALAMILVFGSSLGSNVQGIAAVSVLMVFVYLHTRFTPFNSTFKTLNRLETFSLLVSFFVFVSGLYFNDPKPSELGRNVVSVLVLLMICSFLTCFLWDLYEKVVIYCRLSLEGVGEVPENSTHKGIVLVLMFLRFKLRRLKF